MTATEVLNELKGSNESRCDIKFESNSRGINWSLHVYSGVTEEEINDAIFKAKFGKEGIEKMLKSGEV